MAFDLQASIIQHKNIIRVIRAIVCPNEFSIYQTRNMIYDYYTPKSCFYAEAVVLTLFFPWHRSESSVQQ
uniref:PK_Tyr_Ser-Thr domain-containing protein n=1 Tax=Macrostomum lignano TaxID=282301 RepID=A0A1I8FF45_9PLAT